jgi:hypothetical protein
MALADETIQWVRGELTAALQLLAQPPPMDDDGLRGVG